MSGGVPRTDLEVSTGESVDISEYANLDFYNLIWYWDNPEEIENPCIGIWLDISHQVGSELCYWILTDKVTIFPRTTVQHVTTNETKGPNISDKVKD